MSEKGKKERKRDKREKKAWTWTVRQERSLQRRIHQPVCLTLTFKISLAD